MSIARLIFIGIKNLQNNATRDERRSTAILKLDAQLQKRLHKGDKLANKEDMNSHEKLKSKPKCEQEMQRI